MNPASGMRSSDITICNQAKALEGMRQRLKSHMMKLTDRQRMIDKMEPMIARRDERICQLKHQNKHLLRRLEEAIKDRPEGYDSELTRKCQELAEAREEIGKMDDLVNFLLRNAL